jgi:rod shape-determining protein MreC
MLPSDPLVQRWPMISPGLVTAVILAAALGLAFVPRPATQKVRGVWREALWPGLIALSDASQWASDRWAEFRCGDSKLPEAERKIAALSDQVRTLQTQLLLAHSDRPSAATEENSDSTHLPPLLVAQSISARVLGQQAQLFLPPRDLLDAGQTKGIKTHALVIDDNRASADAAGVPLLDEGRDGSIQQGRLVLAGSRVWGKIAETGPHTSTVQRVTDQGYRDVVQIARRQDGHLHFAARGMLVGEGQGLCKIETLQVTQPVTVGDLVFTADDGALDVPLLYGSVARVERKAGATQWEIWMQPAVEANSLPTQVAVLTMELNPARIAATVSGR